MAKRESRGRADPGTQDGHYERGQNASGCDSQSEDAKSINAPMIERKYFEYRFWARSFKKKSKNRVLDTQKYKFLTQNQILRISAKFSFTLDDDEEPIKGCEPPEAIKFWPIKQLYSVTVNFDWLSTPDSHFAHARNLPVAGFNTRH